MKNLFFSRVIWILLAVTILVPTLLVLTGANGSQRKPAIAAVQAQGDQASKSSISWTTNYSEAVERSKAEGKPILLFFTGSDWCSWCTKLEQEVFHTQSFIQKVADRFIFVELDYPMHKNLAASLKEQNKNLQNKYAIKGYPSVVIVDSEGNKLASTGYQAGGGDVYAAHLDNLVAPHLAKFRAESTPEVAVSLPVSQVEVERQLALLRDVSVSQRDIVIAAELAKAVPNQNLLRAGYLLVKDGSKIREKLLNVDPYHQDGTEFFLGLSDYVKNGSLKGLITFAERVGTLDQENLWKAELTISKGLLKDGKNEEALIWAEKSLSHSPSPAKEEVQSWITSLKPFLQEEKVAVESNIDQI